MASRQEEYNYMSKTTIIYVIRQSVSWCFEPSQPQRTTSELKTNFYLSPCYSFHKSLCYTSFFFFFCCCSNHSSNLIHSFGTQNQKNSNTYFGPDLYSASTQHGNLHPAGWPTLFCWPTQEPVLATANTGKTRERFWKKNAGEWTRRVENQQGKNSRQ